MEKRTREAIEACRPHSDDLANPEMREGAEEIAHDPEARVFYARVQQWDSAITAAMQSGSVPAGLVSRLLSALRADHANPADEHAPVAAAGEKPYASISDDVMTALAASGESAASLSAAERSYSSRRRWLAACASIAATIVVAAFLNAWLRDRSPLPLEEQAVTWVDQLSPAWQDISRAPSGFQVPAALLAAPVTWQWMEQGRQGVAYQVETAAGVRATLFVVKSSRTGLPSSPPAMPQSTTGGRAIGYWRAGDQICVLVVPGDARSYRALVNPAAAPLA
jgi:hypothetical protein